MPCWFYEKPDLINTPSFKDGIDAATEARYRREGARFIIDAGTSQGLRYDTMATGVVYFHRFYMFHSFKEFPRFLTGAACLFLAGKVEETPKKCKDIIRMAKALVPDPHFATFGDDPKEEIMTYERILLQTIKFELQVSHPYSYLLKYAKSIKGDKNKIQKLVQMAWTFVNDSLCTTLCLQWEPHIVATAFLYLAGRLSKSDLLDWSGKSSKVKWWDQLTDDVSLDIMEDICHQLLDLYSSGQQKGGPLPGTPPKGGKKKASKSAHSLLESAKDLDEPREKVAKVEKSRDPASKAAPSPAPSAQGAPPVVTEYASQPAQAPPPPPKQVPLEQPATHPAPPATSYPSQPPRPAPPTAPPPQQVAPAAPQANQYYQGTYTAAAPAPAVAGATAPPTTYASTGAPQQTYSQPSQPYQAPQTPVTPAPAPAAQSSYQAGQYGTAPAYGTQYYNQQSTYNQQYQQPAAQPTYPASAPSTAPATSQAPTQYGTQYAGQYAQSALAAQPTQPTFDPSVPPPRIQAPSNVPPSIHAPPSHPPPPTPPTHAQPAHPPSYPHQPPPQTYAPQSNPPTPTVPPPQNQSYGYNPPPYQMQPQNVGVPRGPPPAPHHGQAPAPNVSTGLATVRISSRESAWPGQHRGPSQNSQEWD